MQPETLLRIPQLHESPRLVNLECHELQPSAVLPAQPPEEQVLGQYIPMLYHYNMLQDEDRVGAFRSAVDLIVQPGMHVLELGGGTGILSSFAARRGAMVSCVERNPELVACAAKFMRGNKLQDQVTVIAADASKYLPGVPVDVVVCEMLHVGLLREKQAQVIAAFKRNYTREFGNKLPVFIPEVSILMLQPVQHSFDFAGFHAPVPLFQAPLLDQPRTVQLAPFYPYANISYDEDYPVDFCVHQVFEAKRSGNMNAIRFATQNVLAIDMNAQRATTWANQCLVLPLPSPIRVQEGQQVFIDLQYSAGGSIEHLLASMKASAFSHRTSSRLAA